MHILQLFSLKNKFWIKDIFADVSKDASIVAESDRKTAWKKQVIQERKRC